MAASYDLPFCPQLPQLEGDMVVEWLGTDPSRCGWSPERDRERPRAWNAFLAGLKVRPPDHGMVKLQVTGPLTLAVALESREGSLTDRRAAIELAGEVATWLAATAADQVRAIDALGLEAVLVVDEPAIEMLALDPDRAARAWDPLRAVAPAWGLHVCCRVPWDVVLHAAPDLLSFNLAGTGAIDRIAATGLANLMHRGARVAWGLVAVDSPDGTAEAARWLHEASVSLGVRGITRERLFEQSLITPSCGTALTSVGRERQLVSALDSAAGAARAWAPLAPSR